MVSATERASAPMREGTCLSGVKLGDVDRMLG